MDIFRNFLIASLSSTALSGCAINQSCVAIDNPDEEVFQAIVESVEQIPGPVLLNPPRSVVINGESPEGGNGELVALAALVILGAASGADPNAIQAATSVAVSDHGAGGLGLYSGITVPANPNVTVAGACNTEGTLLENGATRYTVKSENLRYEVSSAYPGFKVGDCVKVFVARNGATTNARVARGFKCRQP